MKINFCKTSRLMSECGAKCPEDCEFYEKATYHCRCTFQTIDLGFGDYNCANPKARQAKQDDEKILDLELEELLMEEKDEGDIEI